MVCYEIIGSGLQTNPGFVVFRLHYIYFESIFLQRDGLFAFVERKEITTGVVALAVVGYAVVGLIDQQPSLVVLLSIDEITLFQRFACWSKRPTRAYTSLGNYIVSRGW